LRHNGIVTAPPISIPREEIADFCRRNGIGRLALFGSVLTGEFSESSDVDVLVQFRPQERVGFFRLADMETQLSGLFGGRKVDLRTPMDLSRHFRDEVLRDSLVLYAEV
jgi:predicted nucleotidyltransferase